MEYNPKLLPPKKHQPLVVCDPKHQGNHKTEESCAIIDQNGDQPQKMKNNRGKSKICIEPILNKSKKQVTFSKRRGGLFKKAGDFCRRSGSQVAIVTFSCAGKLYPFGYPNADQVINRYLGSQESGRTQSCGFWWENPIDGLGLDQLEEFKTALMGLRNRAASKLHHINSSWMGTSQDHHPVTQLSSFTSNNFGSASAPQGFSLVSNEFGSTPQASSFASNDFGSALPDFGSCSAPQNELFSQVSGFTRMDQSHLCPQVTGFISTDQSDLCPQGSGSTSMDQSDDFWLDVLKSCY